MAIRELQITNGNIPHLPEGAVADRYELPNSANDQRRDQAHASDGFERDRWRYGSRCHRQ